jgi:hypothetical protein
MIDELPLAAHWCTIVVSVVVWLLMHSWFLSGHRHDGLRFERQDEFARSGGPGRGDWQ